MRLSYLLVLLLPLLLTNCKKEENVLFRMEYNETFEIKAGLNTFETHHFLIQNRNTNINSYLAGYGGDASELMAINPRSARLETLFSNATYDIVLDVSVRIYEDDPNDYKEIFYREDVPLNTGATLDLIPTLVDVKEMMTEDRYNIDVAFLFRNPPPEFIESRLTFDFFVK